MELEIFNKVYWHDPKYSTFVPPRGRNMPGIAPGFRRPTGARIYGLKRAGSGAIIVSVSSNLELAAII
ncbi:uncharacterized protein PgNI_12172 [Pyricularia grisea]|uniref:Uncharacterized protein n=1 Tax=Pyricularia grisea TaxID=148305 RepID=A0A6P8AQB0_PYRGI|nr:uncharacterized protein PgNI_12172 [Pyricularia grisea]TLD04242.1 hypothetical protein PgNI_12172 [Pyricularia grisea]